MDFVPENVKGHFPYRAGWVWSFVEQDALRLLGTLWILGSLVIASVLGQPEERRKEVAFGVWMAM